MPRSTASQSAENGTPGGSLLRDTLRMVTRQVARRPKVTLFIVLLLSSACIGGTICFIDFKTERSDLIDPDAAFHQRWKAYTEDFGEAADIVVVVESESPSLVKQALDDLGTQMRREPDLFSNVFFRFEPGKLRGKGLQYLSPDQLEQGLGRLEEYSPILQGRWDLIQLESLFSRLRYQLESRRRQAAPAGEMEPLLEHAELLSTSMLEFLETPSKFSSPWPQFLPVDQSLQNQGGQAVYLLNNNGTMGFIKVKPHGTAVDFSGSTGSIDRLREMVATVMEEYPGTKIGLTGIPVLESDEMRRSQTDMLLASGLSFAGVGLLLFLGFRGFRHPMLAMIMLAIAMAWAFGYTTLAVGHLNILSVSFAVILIGLGIDFAIHYLARYLELRHEGRMLRPALLETSGSVGTGILTAAITTALAFFCATFTDFLGIAELGIIAGGGILLCAVATFTVLPALIALSDRNVEPRKLPTPFQLTWLRAGTSRFPLVVVLLSVVVIGGFASRIAAFEDGRLVWKLRYDYNLLNLQADGIESVDIQRRIFNEANDSLLYAVSVASSPEEARQLRHRFEALPTVHHVEELASHLPGTASRETRLMVQAFQARLARLPDRPPQVSNVNPSNVGRALEQLFITVRDSPLPAADRVASRVDQFLDRFERLTVNQQIAFLSDFQYRTSFALLQQFRTLAHSADPEPVALADLPGELTSRFVSQGKWLLQIYPSEPIWDVEPLTRFVSDVRSIDPEVTGTPLQNYEASRQILFSYRTAAIYALAVITLVLLVDFLDGHHKLLVLGPPLLIVVFIAMMLQTRRIEIQPAWLLLIYLGISIGTSAVLDVRNLRDALLAILPSMVGALLMAGILAVLQVDLNPANLIVLPLVLGIGVDDGVHVVHDYRLQEAGMYRTSSSTMNAIVLTSFTSMIGFGSMMVAAHRGLYSVGLVLVVGVGSCLVVSLVLMPALLTLISRREGQPDIAGSTVEADDDSSSSGDDRRKIRTQQRRAA
ncbi:MAG: MMPL family transporter [Planctomycetaceae bacterium]|nr:MMPL family transporter [Planctomycetaceae bacterium]